MSNNFESRTTTSDINANSSCETQSPQAYVLPTNEELREENDVAAEQELSKLTLYRKRFFRNKAAVVGLIVFAILVLAAIVGPIIARFSYDFLDFAALSEPPNAIHWFGTNGDGGDLFAMSMHGLGRSIIIAVSVSFATVLISAIVGCVTAFLGGKVEKAMLTVIHFLLVIPSFLILALVVSSYGGDWKILIVALIAFGWMYQARVIWSLAISVREREYVTAARFMGVPGFKIVLRHMIPNIGSLLVINLTLGVVSTVMSETGLSFLGLGVKIPDVSLGTLLSAGVNSLESQPWLFLFPAGILTLLTVSMALISDGLRDALDPNSAAGGRA
ncbi:ABC transporter permease [Arcanobacterium hippocoleae]|uniref:Oligopeptide transport system permease protein OppC n=1 Tax=Arcanobacterium hippocoleae TaxID=149017 RepID=A0ABU1T0G9_9ACTO|nr:ABC transporter permease [Arcanobacterium hippocoleae]MDR6938864.1 peptide/nickel transport system permease protein [Arcanobacterium hippocoleae]